MPVDTHTDLESPPAKTTPAEPTQEPTAEPTAPAYLQQLLAEIATREDFATGYVINTVCGTNVGDGFQALMLRASIVGRRHGVDNQRLDLVCKVPPQSEVSGGLVAPAFRSEVFAYETLLPTLIQMQSAKGIAPADGFYSFPKCYGTYSNDAAIEYAIVLEDLKARDFRMWNKFETIDLAHVKLVLAQLGRYHALSFALRDQRPDVMAAYAQRGGGMLELIARYPDDDPDIYKRVIDLMPADEVELREKMRNLDLNSVEIMRKVATGKSAEPFAVMCHGDCWNNNMMFEYGSDDSKVAKSVCVIDWQLVQYCSPATDLAYFIYSSTEQGLRREHFDDMLAVYHESLTTLLTQMGCDAGRLFSFEALAEHMRDFAVYALILAPMLVQVMSVDLSDVNDMDAFVFEEIADNKFVGADRTVYERRIRDVFRDFNERGFFEGKHNKYVY